MYSGSARADVIRLFPFKVVNFSLKRSLFRKRKKEMPGHVWLPPFYVYVNYQWKTLPVIVLPSVTKLFDNVPVDTLYFVLPSVMFRPIVTPR